MTLKELLSTPKPVDVVIDGETYLAHRLSTFDAQMLEQLYPSPRPPMREKRNSRGGFDPPAPDDTDPAYVTASQGWFIRFDLGSVAIALRDHFGLACTWPQPGLVPTEHEVRECRVFLEAAIPLLGKAAYADIRAAALRVRGVGIDPLKAAEGNSSSGAGAVPAPQPSGGPPSPLATS